MSSIVANENKKLGQEIINQELRNQERRLSGKQEDYKIQSAQDLLKNLQIILNEGEVPGTELINDILLKAEQFLVQASQSAQIDPDTRKTLEDIKLLIGSTKQMARNRDLGDRLQRISDETAKLVANVTAQGAKLSPEAKEASLEIVSIIANWRPLFELLISSREFRVLIVDAVKIVRKVLSRHNKEGLGDKAEQQFLEGAPVKQITQDVAQETKETFQDSQGNTEVRISDKEFELLYTDVTRILITLARTPSYRSGIDNMFNLVDILQNHLGEPTSEVPESVQLHAKRAQLETEQLITTFTGQKVLDNFVHSLKKVVKKMNQETQTREYLKELKTFILDTKTVEKLSEKETKERLKKFARDGREIVEQFKYGDELYNFMDATDRLFESFKNDEFVTILRHHAGLVADDLSFVDNEGNVKLDTDMIGKLRGVMGPIIAESLKYIPIPKIEDNNEDTHFWVDNVVLCGYDVIPDKIRVQMESDSKINIREIQTDHSHTNLIITLDHIKTEIKNLEFFYHRKTFPQITEQGRATLRLPGDGATLIIRYYVKQSIGEVIPVFHEGKVDFQIHNFELEFDKKTLDHDILIPLITSMFKLTLQRRIERAVEENLGGLVSGIGEKLTAALVEVNRPLMFGMDKVKQSIKSTEVGQVFEKRREKLE